ncbi:BTB/POZ domain-containing protein [Fadolivirus algeromassiliense]|jgi:hypothetical protein|uniref:BTB/POZ domain-containing protein n=1 Tax=Fadolivirus FV1/VV64 TaxID=3070911 RepID=A0A7D3UVA9_9VIRU|nr:BTB/POZ domain-containing protein [Fadolivirus algeromassiliense]QKF93874.1 BTB/POZ domain-containing protein [Fadolivirus FV1/VV64]
MKSTYGYLLLISSIILFGGIFVSQYWKMSEYADQINKLKNQLFNTENKLSEAESRTFALGTNLWNKKHTYDIKFVIENNNHIEEFYAHKHILIANSPYFEILFSHNTTNEIKYFDIDIDEFNLVMEILYFGKFNSAPKLIHLNNIVRFLNSFMILDKYTNHIDNVYSNMFLNKTYSDEYNSIELVSNVYDLSIKHNFNNIKTNILKNIYLNWKSQGLFNKNHISNYPVMFYDYIRYLNCINKYSFN